MIYVVVSYNIISTVLGVLKNAYNRCSCEWTNNGLQILTLCEI